ncbi:MAG: primase, primase protein [Candidatus Parcubacteria bacterium]
MNPKDQIKENLSIVDVVSTYIRLEKSGHQFRARCPFHNERTPSFYVSPERKSFHCFGCQVHGDIFTFVEKIENIPFVEALKILADRAGVSLVDKEKNKEESRLVALLKDATHHLQKNLEESVEAKQYLMERGLSDETIATFQVGYAKNEWRNLFIFLASKGYQPEEMVQAGLVIEAHDEHGRLKGYYDRFRGRVMFPIRNISGVTVGYSGRIMPSLATDTQGKYVNTPETPLYHKSKILFGYDTAKKKMNETKEVVIVEGQMDLCMSFQSGVHNTVAVSGTAFTDDHIHMIKRFCDTVILSFDMDNAGQNALKKTGLLCLLGGLDVYVIGDIGTKDPADLIKDAPESWHTAIQKKKHIVEKITDAVIHSEKDERVRGKKIVNDVLPFVRAIQSPIDRAHFLRLVAQKTGIAESTLTEELSRGILHKEETIQTQHTIQSLPVKERLTKELIAFSRLYRDSEKDKEMSLLELDLSLFPDALIEEEMFMIEKRVIADKNTYFKDLMTSYKREEHKEELIRLQKKLKEEGADVEAILQQIYSHVKKRLDG